MDDSKVNERINELYELYKEEKEFWNDVTREVNEEFGIELSRDAVRGRGRRWERSGEKSKLVIPKEKKEKDESIIEDIPLSEDETLDDFIARKQIDLDTFSIVEATMNEYAGNEQIKVRVRPKTPDAFSEEDFLNKVASVVQRDRTSPKQILKKEENKDSLFVPCLFDAHIDSPAFKGDYLEWLQRLIEMGFSSGYNAKRILFIVGNDFGHIDNQEYETTSGTLVGSTRTYMDSVDERCSVILDSCDLLLNYTSNLDIAFVPGNHDRFSTYWLGKVVDAYYADEPHVNLLDGQNPRKYYRYGKNLFGLTHGSDEKKFDLAALMAVESPQEWALSENRIWLTGHLHQKNRAFSMLSEQFGVVQRIFPSLCSPDDWHILKGYIGNSRSAEMLVYNTSGKLAEFQLSIG